MPKPQLRLQLIASLRALSPGQRGLASAEICGAVRAHPAWRAARFVCAFLPLPNEPQIAPLWEAEGAPDFCFPRIQGEEVTLIHLTDRALLQRSDWKFEAAEIAHAPLVAVDAVDLFLVPALGFTESGSRLGRGGGYYDRLLSRRHPASTALGLAFACQILPELPREPHDQPVDAVLSA